MWDTVTDFLGWLIAVVLMIVGTLMLIALCRSFILLDWSVPWHWGYRGRIVIVVVTLAWFLIGLSAARRGDDE